MRLLDETLRTRRARAEAGSPVDLGPVFAAIYLGAETARLERLLAETAARGLIREAPGTRCFCLTAEGAAAAGNLRRRPRWIAFAVILGLIVSGVVALLVIG